MLQLRELGGQRLVGLHQLRELASHRGDLSIPRRELPDQLLTRGLIRRGHPKIKAHISRSPCDRHAHHPDVYAACTVTTMVKMSECLPAGDGHVGSA